MTYKDNQNIDRILTDYYRAEARKIILPDHRRCWQDFQQLLEEIGRPEHFEPDTADITPPDSRHKKRWNTELFRSYRGLTALATAAAFLFLLLRGVLPFPGSDKFSPAAPPPATPENSLLLSAVEMVEETRTKVDAQSTLRAESMEDWKQYNDDMDGQAPPRDQKCMETGPAFSEPAVAFTVPTEEKTDTHVYVENPEQALSGAGEIGVLVEEVEGEEPKEELFFMTMDDYFAALVEYRELFQNPVYYLATPPEGYDFNRGVIARQGTLIPSVRQEFSSKAGDKLILRQDFGERGDCDDFDGNGDTDADGETATAYREPAIAEQAMAAEEAEGAEGRIDGEEPLAAGQPADINGTPWRDHRLSRQNGFNTINWRQDNSVIAITAELEDDTALLTIADQLLTLE